MPELPFCLVLINGSGAHDDVIRGWHPKLILKHLSFDIRPEHLRGYQFCYMTLPLHDLLCEFDEPLVYVDADTIVRGRLNPVFDLLNQYDLVVRYMGGTDLPGPTTPHDGARVNNGLMGLANNARTRAYAAELRRRVVSFLEGGGDPMRITAPDGIVTGLDQELIWVIYQEMSDRMTFFPLDPSFNDSQFMDSSTLWHAKSKTRRNVRYRRAVADHLGERLRHLWLLPEYTAMRAFRYFRTIQWKANLRRGYTIPGLDAIARGLPCRRRALVVNSWFRRFNPQLERMFDDVDVVDATPESYYQNVELLNGRSRLQLDRSAFVGAAYDLVVSEARIPGVLATLEVCHAHDFSRDLTWRTVRPFRGISAGHARDLFVQHEAAGEAEAGLANKDGQASCTY